MRRPHLFKAMLSYPSIPSWKKSPIGKPCIAFYKYDGSNLRWEWTPKRGWYKFGTRTQLMDHSDPLFSQAIPIFQNMIGPIVERVVRDEIGRTERIVAFTEFFGKSSFAGSHELAEEKSLKLIDVSLYKKGFIPPRKFVKLFDGFGFDPAVVYDGNMSQQFIQDVRDGRFPVYEGVVCKGTDDQWMSKVKTQAYLDRLKDRFGQNWELYE